MGALTRLSALFDKGPSSEISVSRVKAYKVDIFSTCCAAAPPNLSTLIIIYLPFFLKSWFHPCQQHLRTVQNLKV